MNKVLAGAMVLVATGAATFAQTPPAATTRPNTPAIATPNTTAPVAPVSGANSFTEGQAKSRIEAAGFSNVSALAKDKDGVWRGKGTKAGASVDVSLDYQAMSLRNKRLDAS